MEPTGKLRLDLLDVYGNRLAGKVDIFLRHQTLSSDTRVVRSISASRRIVVKELLGEPQGLYRVEIDPPSYLPVSYFVNLRSRGYTDRTIFFPADPRKVTRVEFPGYAALRCGTSLLEASGLVEKFEGKAGQALYDGLDDIRRAGLLNILAKCYRTRLAGGGTVLDQLIELTRIEGDRFFCQAAGTLIGSVERSAQQGWFDRASGALHDPPEGFSRAGSFKTPDSYGNLQLTFFSNGTRWMAEIDIDDAGGLEHVFQVVRNALTGRPTHPYDIQQILIRRQELDPGYRLVLDERPA